MKEPSGEWADRCFINVWNNAHTDNSFRIRFQHAKGNTTCQVNFTGTGVFEALITEGLYGNCEVVEQNVTSANAPKGLSAEMQAKKEAARRFSR